MQIDSQPESSVVLSADQETRLTTLLDELNPWWREQKMNRISRDRGNCKGHVKSIPPNTENWLRKLYDKNYNNDTSNEDKHETNYSMNNDTRNMHIT